MVDEDFVMGYVVGQNDVKIVEKTITASGTYHAADDGADGFDPVIVNIDGMSQKGIDDLINWIIDQIMPQLPDETPVPVLPEITVGELRPSIEGYDRPFLLCMSADGRSAEVMYGVMGPDIAELPTKHYYVDTFSDGVLSRHLRVLYVRGEGDGIHSQILADGSVSTTVTFDDGTQKTTISGPYITDSGNTTVWCV